MSDDDLEHFAIRPKPVNRNKMRQTKETEHGFDSIKTQRALAREPVAQDQLASRRSYLTMDIDEFYALLPEAGALLGFDLGEKRIGIAVCDAQRLVASPLGTIARRNRQSEFDETQTLLAGRVICGAVFGHPVNMNNSRGPAAQSARAYARQFAMRGDMPVLLWDERLSTAAVTRMMVEADRSRRRRAEIVDETAAGYILQGAIDRLARLG